MHSYNKERNGQRKLNLLIGKETEEETLKRFYVSLLSNLLNFLYIFIYILNN